MYIHSETKNFMYFELMKTECLAGIIRTLMNRMWKILASQTYTDQSSPAAHFPTQCSNKSVWKRNKDSRTVRCAGWPRLRYFPARRYNY